MMLILLNGYVIPKDHIKPYLKMNVGSSRQLRGSLSLKAFIFISKHLFIVLRNSINKEYF